MVAASSHGYWCNSRTFRIRCRYCDHQVFYFSCACGSKVFFDELGEPWPRHECEQLRWERAGAGPAFAQSVAAGLITFRLEPEYARRVEDAARPSASRRQRSRETLRQDPYVHLQTTEMGVVREILQAVDVYRKFRLERTQIAAAMLGELAAEEFGQITIHTSDLGGDDDSSFTALIPIRRLRAAGIRNEDLASCTLRGAAGYEVAVWVCDEIEVVN